MEYLDYQEPCEAVYEKIANNRVVDFLKAYGYQYVYFGNWYDIGRYEVPADVVFNFYSSGYNGTQLSMNDFQGVLLNTTMLRAYNDQIGSSRYESYYRRGLIETLEQLQKAPTMDGPKFVFAHILCPHQPFVFGPRGERVDYADWYNYRDRQFYLGQYVFISQQIETVLDTLVSESEVPPIIVLQSDHGLRSRVVQGLDVGSDWQKILNAYYLPGNGSEQPYDSMSPVNSFRFIFNHYYDADYTLIED